MSKIIDGISEVIEKTGEAFDKNFTSKEEVLDKVKQAQEHLLEVKKAIILAEANGNWMQRSWRPFLMYLFGIIIFWNAMIAPVLLNKWGIPRPELTHEFWDVLRLSIGGYVIGRTGEKVIPGVTDTVKTINKRRNERRKN